MSGLTKQNDVGLVERAFQMARGGDFDSITEIKTVLRHEGYEQVSAHLAGPTIGSQLRAAMVNARAGHKRVTDTTRTEVEPR
jgi:hypothetical protein